MKWAATAVVLFGFVAFVVLAFVSLTQRGPFRFFGADFVSYYAAARMLANDRPLEMYDPRAMRELELQLLAPWGWDANAVFPMFLNPPAFAVLLLPLTVLPVTGALLAWEILTGAAALAAALLLGRGAYGQFRLIPTLAIAGFYPLLFGLLYGQAAPLMLLGLAWCYLALKAGRDLEAGVAATSLLLLKPQYAPLLLLTLALSRRWNALAGMAIGGLVLLVVSAAMVGPAGIVAYGRVLLQAGTYTSVALPDADPKTMIGWRGLLNQVAPSLPSEPGLGITAVLSLATLAASLAVFPRPWEPNRARFDRGMLLVVLASLLSAFHSNIHGLALALVPGVFVAAQVGPSLARRWLPVGFALPTVLFLVFLDNIQAQALVLGVALVAAVGLLLIDAVRERFADGPTDRALPATAVLAGSPTSAWRTPGGAPPAGPA